MRPLWYDLDRNNNPVPCDAKTAARLLDDSRRIVAKTDLGYCEVSTVFLSLDHSNGNGQPILFETMVFGIQCDGQQYRCCTWQEALWQHEHVCEIVRAMVASQ